MRKTMPSLLTGLVYEVIVAVVCVMRDASSALAESKGLSLSKLRRSSTESWNIMNGNYHWKTSSHFHIFTMQVIHIIISSSSSNSIRPASH